LVALLHFLDGGGGDPLELLPDFISDLFHVFEATFVIEHWSFPSPLNSLVSDFATSAFSSSSSNLSSCDSSDAHTSCYGTNSSFSLDDSGNDSLLNCLTPSARKSSGSHLGSSLHSEDIHHSSSSSQSQSSLSFSKHSESDHQLSEVGASGSCSNGSFDSAVPVVLAFALAGLVWCS